MARIISDSVPPSSAEPARVQTQAQANSYGHGHTSSIGHAHGVIRDALRSPLPADPVPQRVTLVMAVDEKLDPPVALALRVHDEGKVLRPSIFPPRRGERLPQRGLPSTGSQRAAMLQAIFEEQRAAGAFRILVK